MLQPLVTVVAVCTASAALSDVWPNMAKIEGVWRLKENSAATCAQHPLIVDYDDAQNRLTITLGNWPEGDPDAPAQRTFTILSAQGAVLKVRSDEDGALGTITLSADGNRYGFGKDADNGAFSTYLRCTGALVTS